jgi:hypothetical protein
LVIVLGSLALGWSPNFDVLVAIPALVLATRALASFGLLMATIARRDHARRRQRRLHPAHAREQDGHPRLEAAGRDAHGERGTAERSTVARARRRHGRGYGHACMGRAVWAVVGPVLAAKFFRWE